jgi:hypothetical protein
MSDRNDEILPDKNCGFAVGYTIVIEMSGACHDKQLVAIDINLRYLVRFECVLNRKRMKPVILLKLLKLSFRRFEQSDPDKLGFAPAIDGLIQ